MRSKFNVSRDLEKRTYDGIVFDSVMEMKYYRDVVLPLAGSGDIVHYELQKVYVLQPKYVHDGKKIQAINYVADFYLEYADGRVEVIDTKGCADSVAKIKRKMMWYLYPTLTYRWITYVAKYGGWVEYDYVDQCRREARKARKLKKMEECTHDEEDKEGNLYESGGDY